MGMQRLLRLMIQPQFLCQAGAQGQQQGSTASASPRQMLAATAAAAAAAASCLAAARAEARDEGPSLLADPQGALSAAPPPQSLLSAHILAAAPKEALQSDLASQLQASPEIVGRKQLWFWHMPPQAHGVHDSGAWRKFTHRCACRVDALMAWHTATKALKGGDDGNVGSPTMNTPAHDSGAWRSRLSHPVAGWGTVPVAEGRLHTRACLCLFMYKLAHART